jgi:prephenate dehydrogenase
MRLAARASREGATGRAGEAMARLFQFAEGLGAVPHTIDAREHDHLLAFISHLPQLAASALMQIVGDAAGEDGLRLSGRGLQDTTRLAGSPAGIWTEICASNADEIRAAIDALVGALQQLRDHVAERDTIERLFEAARNWRAVLVDKQA